MQPNVYLVLYKDSFLFPVPQPVFHHAQLVHNQWPCPGMGVEDDAGSLLGGGVHGEFLHHQVVEGWLGQEWRKEVGEEVEQRG